MKKIWLAAVMLCLFACKREKTETLFHLLDPSRTGIYFNNAVTENDSINPIDMEFLYNGGGVAAADFNHDGLQDLYFTASTVSNRLFLNGRDLHFTDVTAKSGVGGHGEWSNAATVVDINNDGWEDIYVCTSIWKDTLRRRNLLYVNQGNNKEGIPVFSEMAAAYGLSDTSYSVQAAFSDLDNDGDLDMYLVTTKLAKREAARFNRSERSDTTGIEIDKLYRNDWNTALGHPVFTDVSRQSGIVDKGFGLSVSIADINQDGWKDIYVANDFFGSDLLYINQHDGSFSNKIKTYFHHTSQNAMGNDIADINNDGLPDLITVDMNPEDNYRKKKNLNSSNYYLYQNMLFSGTMLQYVRNTVQLNRGPQPGNNDSTGEPVFSDIGFYAGVAQTDWSWNPSLADFDNDGFRDLIITNGYPKDVTDHDFAAFRRLHGQATKKELLREIPQIKISNYAFRNTQDNRFSNVTESWGMNEKAFSSGAVATDLDNDGDLDYVINNINGPAFIYENTTSHTANHFVDLGFQGGERNRDGYGAIVEIHYGDSMQTIEYSSTHGYLSSPGNKVHFGVGHVTTLDSVIIRWPWIGRKQVIRNIKTDTLLMAKIMDATEQDRWDLPVKNDKALFTDITEASGVQYRHYESDYIDFNDERLLPHKLSQFGPGLTTGDVNGDGLDDIFIGGSGDFPAHFLLQQKAGNFIDKVLPHLPGIDDRRPENMGVLLFDADHDGDPDLYCASGSNQSAAQTKSYQDRLYLNDGKGNFSIDTTALPENHTSKSCIRAADIDGDGDLDLFVGGRVNPGHYPLPVSSFIYRNDTKDGVPRFTDITTQALSKLRDIGLVCDASWTDFDNDGRIDLMLVGEWMSPRFFRNNGHGSFDDVSAQSGVENLKGFWNSICAGDFDNDGDMDYVVGNLGRNSFLQASGQHPVNLYAKDFDGNGSLDLIMSTYLKDRNGQLREFPVANRDDMMEQLPSLKKKFLTYKEYGEATVDDIFSRDILNSGIHLTANEFRTCLLKNNGHGSFQMIPLPPEAQWAPVYGMIARDINQDGLPDLVICGNDYGNEVTNGQYDALGGLALMGHGDGRFSPLSSLASGISITGDAKALVTLQASGGHYLLAASQNQGRIKIYRQRKDDKCIPFRKGEDFAILTLDNGRYRKIEVGGGNSFLSHSSEFVVQDKHVRIIEFYGRGKLMRTVK